jgi:hypothetical protein
MNFDRATFSQLSLGSDHLADPNKLPRELIERLLRDTLKDATPFPAAATFPSPTTTNAAAGRGGEGVMDGEGASVIPAAEKRNPISDGRATKLSILIDGGSSAVGRLLQEEKRLVAEREVKCRKVEHEEKKYLLQHQGTLTEATDLTDLEGRLNDALLAIVGVEQHMRQANARCTRARHVVERTLTDS